MTDHDDATSPLNRESRGSIPEYYNKAGVPIGLMEWARLFEDINYKQVLATDVHSLDDPTYEVVRVSTVWLGLDHNWMRGMVSAERYRPHIFESMVFQGHEWSEYWDRQFNKDHDQIRYSTLREAWLGHFSLVREWREKVPRPFEKMDWEPHPYILAEYRQEVAAWHELRNTARRGVGA